MIALKKWPIAMNLAMHTAEGQTLSIHTGAQLAYVGEDELNGAVVISFVVDTANRKRQKRTFKVVKFGQEVPPGWVYVDRSFMQYGGALLWHLIERVSE